MKKSFLLLPIIGAFAYITLSSDSNGPSGNLTGSTTTVGCGPSSCHSTTAATGINITFELDSAGHPVTKYKPGGVYTLKMIGTNTTVDSLPKFGYQMVTVKGTSNTQAGTWSTVPSGSTLRTSSSVSVLEHNTPNSPSSLHGMTGTVYTISAGWTAPAAGTGTVTVHAVLNAVNGNGTNDANDRWNTSSATFAELIPSGVANTTAENMVVSAYPNPVSSTFTVDLGNNQGAYSIAVFDMSGRLVATQAATDSKVILNASAWAAGMYQLNITKDGTIKTISVIKQ